MENTYTVTVFNTITSEYEEVSVSKAVYNEYRRGEWRVQKNDEKHGDNETPFSSLIGGENAAYENFHEFIDESQNPLLLVLEKEEAPELHKAICQLSEEDRLLVESIFFKGMSEREYAEKCGVFRNAVHKRKRRILGLLKNILEK